MPAGFFHRLYSSRHAFAALLMLMSGMAHAEPGPQGQILQEVKPSPAVSQANPPETDSWATFMQERRYEIGEGVKRSSVRAHNLYGEALNNGGPEVRRGAAYALGVLHLRKPLYAPKEAARFLMLGIAQKDSWSAYKLAELREKGLGVPRSATKAQQLYLSITNDEDATVQRATFLALGRLHTKKPLRNSAKAAH